MSIWKYLLAGIVIPLVLIGPHSGPHTLTLRQGLNGYTGVTDTWVSSNDWDTPPQHTVNYGQNSSLRLDRDGGDNPLIRFDLSSIPANSHIQSAILYLYNTTSSCDDGGCTTAHPRRVRAFRVLRAWDEGNQVSSPINAPGKHGATGDYAFRYYENEGTSVPWEGRGMVAGKDYAQTAESSTDVTDPGWYTWDITALVQAWVRKEVPNYGIVLRDATGWEEHHTDWRVFYSSQHVNPSLRPRLVITYDSDVPFAVAGPDQEILQWDGSPITLDGSGSRDRAGGHTDRLTYQWRIKSPAYESTQKGIIGTKAVITFRPDVPGEWTFELTVTNDLGKKATDSVHVRLLRIPHTHPRIYLTPSRLATLRARATSTNPRWQLLKSAADAGDGMLQAALVGVISNEEHYCVDALAQAQRAMRENGDCSSCPGDIALVYDWCYVHSTPAQRDAFITYFNNRAAHPGDDNVPGWGNYWPRYGYSLALMGIATYGENPQAKTWLDQYRYAHVQAQDTAMLDLIAEGGGWPEGMVYDWIANVYRFKATAAWESGTGERLFASTPWYRERFGYLLLHQWPGTAQEWGYTYHPYTSTGDSERNRGTMANYGRIMALILRDRYPTHPLAAQLQAYLSAPPVNTSDSFLAHDEFLWFNPDAPTAPPRLRTHYAAGTGTLFMRSGWPSGAADTNTKPTYITFQAGDFFTYHQHYDQNAFTLFKYTPLLLDSGVYSGEGLSYHDTNYYVRTIAHNTLIVYNPQENFEAARPDAISNDGGQRTMYPASRYPPGAAYYAQHRIQYDTADMLRFEDGNLYTYALGDATKAYNNPQYNQAQLGLNAYQGNVAKVSRFQREMVYLRPVPEDNRQRDYLVLWDRVGVTQAQFSGANTKLLFHTFTRPDVTGPGTVISPGETLYRNARDIHVVHGAGALFMKVLWPQEANIRVVGGRGQKAFWVFDNNYDWHWSSSEPQPRPVNDFEDTPYGEWRVELEPADTALDHTFLTVLYPTARSTTSSPPMYMVEAEGGMRGVHIADDTLNRVVLFSDAMDGHAPANSIQYTLSPTAETLHILFDLPPNARYNLTTHMDNDQVKVNLTRSNTGALRASRQGVLQFTIPWASNGTATPTATSTATPTNTPTPSPTPTVPETPAPTPSPSPTVTPTPTMTTTPASQPGYFITYSRNNHRVYRIAAQPGATPEDISARLNNLSPGSEDYRLNISPNGRWFVLETDRFGCTGWPCLAVVAADFSTGEAVTIAGTPVHPEGSISAISNNGNLVIYASNEGPHGTDLYASTRTSSGWSSPTLLTGHSTYWWHSMPALSQDGSKVLFDCDNSLDDVGEAICEVHTNGSGFRVVLTPADGPGPRYNPVHSPDYAPDGSIVFEGDWDGETIWRLPVGKTLPVKVGGYNNDNSPCVLPDGRIASLWLDRPGGPSVDELKVMSANGAHYFMVLPNVGIHDVGLGCGGYGP